MSQEFYDLSERLLNSDDYCWGNLGYWQFKKDYSSACCALADELAIAVQLGPLSHVFDVGFGCGDQLLLWLKTYHVNTVQGINYSVSQTELAIKRLGDAGFTEVARQIQYGSIADMSEQKTVSSKPAINTVLALDCAYHFPSRTQFFAHSYQKLTAAGRIGLTDILLSDQPISAWQYCVLRTMLSLSRIPAKNIVTLSCYKKELTEAGFEGIEIRDISEHVFLPFSEWLQEFKQGEGQLKSASKLTWIKYDITAKFLKWAFQNNILRYSVISANKPS